MEDRPHLGVTATHHTHHHRLTGGAASTATTPACPSVFVVPGPHLTFKHIVQQTVVYVDVVLAAPRIIVRVVRIVTRAITGVVVIVLSGVSLGRVGLERADEAALLGQTGHSRALRDAGGEGPGQTVGAGPSPAALSVEQTLRLAGVETEYLALVSREAGGLKYKGERGREGLRDRERQS